MLARLAMLLLPFLAVACLDNFVRHGDPVDVQRVSEWDAGTTNLAQASESLGIAPAVISCSGGGETTAVWSSYLEMVGWQPPLILPECVVVAHFDSGGRLLRVVAGDLQSKQLHWYFPSDEEFFSELSSTPAWVSP